MVKLLFSFTNYLYKGDWHGFGTEPGQMDGVTSFFKIIQIPHASSEKTFSAPYQLGQETLSQTLQFKEKQRQNPNQCNVEI